MIGGVDRQRMVIVGGGIVGTMHALEATGRGYEVVQLEREVAPRGATVRNFGLVWVSGRAAGRELAVAARARQRWEEIAGLVPGTGFRANGSLTVATSEEEWEVLVEAAELPDATERGFELLDAEAARRHNPALTTTVRGALLCRRDAAVESRLVLGVLRQWLAERGGYRFLPGREVVDIAERSVADSTGEVHGAARVVLCCGAWHSGVLGEILADAPLRRVRLQMLETERYAPELTTSLADGDSLRYYPAYRELGLGRLGAQTEVATHWAAQLLLVQRRHGGLTIGDTHARTEPFPFDTDEAPYAHLLAAASALLEAPLPPVERRWAGIYSEVTEDAPDIYWRQQLSAGVELVTGAGGRGMTMAPAIAEETFL